MQRVVCQQRAKLNVAIMQWKKIELKEALVGNCKVFFYLIILLVKIKPVSPSSKYRKKLFLSLFFLKVKTFCAICHLFSPGSMPIQKNKCQIPCFQASL
jgi:hypothetical protein